MVIALLRSRCHAPTVMLANLIATPIELRYSVSAHLFSSLVMQVSFFFLPANWYILLSSLLVPFLRFGETLCGGPQFPLTSDALKKVLTGQASREVLLSIAHAVSCLNWHHVLF